MKLLIVALLLTCLAVVALGCGGSSQVVADEDGATSQVSSSPDEDSARGLAAEVAGAPSPTPINESSDADESDGEGEHSSSSSADDSDEDSGESGSSSSASSSGGDSGTVSRENPGFSGVGFDIGRNDALADSQPLDAVTWVVEPTISAGALDAKGTLKDGATLFDPMIDGEGAGFIIYFKGVSEPLLLLLPDLGPMHIWETDLTVADMEHEFEGASFEIRAYSPLFMDVGPGDLEIRAFGYDGDGDDALLAVHPVTVP